MEANMYRSALCTLCFLVYAMLVPSTPALSLTMPNSDDQAPLLSQNQLRLAQTQCWRRIGPFATQDTAWTRWRTAQGQGYSVSNGVVPCSDQSGTRGYCFNVFFAC